MGEAKRKRAESVERVRVSRVDQADHRAMAVIDAAKAALATARILVEEDAAATGEKPADSVVLSVTLQSCMQAAQAGGTDFNAVLNGLGTAFAWAICGVPEGQRHGLLASMFGVILMDARESAAVEDLATGPAGGHA